MTKVKNLKDRISGELFYPITHKDAIIGLSNVAKSGSYNDLLDTPTIPAAQILSDWNLTDTTAKDYILNKPEKFAATVVEDRQILGDPDKATYEHFVREIDTDLYVENKSEVEHPGIALCASTNTSQVTDLSVIKSLLDPTGEFVDEVLEASNVYLNKYASGASPLRIGAKSSSGSIKIRTKKECTLLVTPYFGWNPTNSVYNTASLNYALSAVTYSSNDEEYGDYSDSIQCSANTSILNYLDTDYIPQYSIGFDINGYGTITVDQRTLILGFETEGWTEDVYSWRQIAYKDDVDSSDENLQDQIDNLSTVASTGDYDDLINLPEIGEVQVYNKNSLPEPTLKYENKIVRIGSELYTLARGDKFIFDFVNWPYSTITVNSLSEYCKLYTNGRNLFDISLFELTDAWQKTEYGLQLGNASSKRGVFTFKPEQKTAGGTSCATFTAVISEVWPYREGENCFISINIDDVGDICSKEFSEFIQEREGSYEYKQYDIRLELNNSDYFCILTDNDQGRRAIIKRFIFENLQYDGELISNELYWKRISTSEEELKENQKITIRRWEDNAMYVEGVYIETVSGKLIKSTDWENATHPNGDKRKILDQYDRVEIANTIYISDGYRKVRLGLEWCNPDNCTAKVASSDAHWSTMVWDEKSGSWKWPKDSSGNTDYSGQGNSDYIDSGEGTTKYHSSYAEGDYEGFGAFAVYCYRLMLGHYTDWLFNDGEIIDCLSYYDTWDWGGKRASELLVANSTLYNKMPALQAVNTSVNAKGETGYLMGISEITLAYGYNKEELNNCLKACGGHPFDSVGELWSISCYGENGFWFLSTGHYGNVDGSDPYDCGYYVRPAF